MATRIVMPSFGMYTAEGTFARWLLEPGSPVTAGELVAEITTEKASYEIEAPASGVLHPLAQPGDALTVEGLLGWVLAAGERAPPAERDAEPVPVSGLPFPAATPTPAYARAKASPAARRLAAERGVELAALTGSGPGGRIVEADVLAAAGRASLARRAATDDGSAAPVADAAPADAMAAPAPAASPAAAPRVPWRVQRRIPLAGIRGTTARRLREAVATTVPLTLSREVRAGAVLAARSRLAEELAPVPWDALFVKLFADALRERPALNAVVAGDEILVLDEVHVGFAVAVAEGLVVPVVRDADRRPLAEVIATVRSLAARARAGALAPPDVLGGTATVSNLGAHGVDAFTPVLNPPQSAILGVGRIASRAVVDEGSVIAAATCVLSLTFDHRVADGAPAAELLAAVAARMGDAAYLEALTTARERA